MLGEAGVSRSAAPESGTGTLPNARGEPSVVAERYEIERELGQGGMGRVFVALDRKIGRKVAIKMLAAGLHGEEALRRFEQEARAAGALNHPNILDVHDIGTWQGEPYIVSELLEGETLSERLRRGPLPLADTTAFALQLAQGLCAAHDKGVIHRDLKPENLFVTKEGRLKILDFGIAKLVEPPLPESETLPSSRPRTQTGAILGTVGYMSPEQVRGQPVDYRSDLFSSGTILYEMLTGRTAFERDTPVETGSAILNDELPPLPAQVPLQLQNIVRCCLEKKPQDRFQSTHELALQLQQLSSGATAALVDKPVWRSPLLLLIVALLVAGASTVITLIAARRTAPQPTLTQITFTGIAEYPAWSPDRKQILYAAQRGPTRKIVRKDLAGGGEEVLTHGDSDDLQPAWSPDGQKVLFVRARQLGQKLEPGDEFGLYEDGDVWQLDLRSGRETMLLSNAFHPAYAPDGRRIALDSSWAGPRRIWVVDDQGHNPQQVTTDSSEAVVHMAPRWAPDGRKIAFQSIERTKFDVRVVDLETRQQHWITNDYATDIAPAWSASGKYVYFTSDRAGAWNIWRAPVGPDGAAASPLQQVTTGAGKDVEVAVSVDGRRLAFATRRQNADLWRLPVSPADGKPSGAPEPVIATTREDSRGAWSPDGGSIAFNSDRGGDMNIWLYSLKDGKTRPLTSGRGGDFQPNWSPDDRTIAFFSSRNGTANIWTVEVATGKTRALTTSSSSLNSNPFFAPDGTRIAFHSDRSGRNEIWVMNADGSGARQLTDVGVSGHFLRWTDAGDAVIFRCTCSGRPATMRVMAAGGEPVPLVEQKGGAHISFSPDRSRIMDVVAHKVLWVTPVNGGAPEKVFAFPDPGARIDYPVWSPDGKWVLFDLTHPQGGDIWQMRNFE